MCGNMTLISERAEGVKAVRLRCQSWTCNYCAPRRRKRLMKEAGLGLPNKLLTITANPAEFETPDQAAQALSLAWRRCRDTLKRFHGHKAVECMMIFEKHKSGWPHLHILLRSNFIPQRWISAYFARRLNSPIVDIRAIKTKRQAINYVAKYIGKDPHRFKGVKRYWRTKFYTPPREKKKKSEHPWRVSAASIEMWLYRFGLIVSPNMTWPEEEGWLAPP